MLIRGRAIPTATDSAARNGDGGESALPFSRRLGPARKCRTARLPYFIAIALAVNVMVTTGAWSRVIYASPGGGVQVYNGRPVETRTLNEAVREVLTSHSDTVIQLVEGHYDLKNRDSITITRHPRDDKPYGRIIVRGLGSGTVIDGGRDPVSSPAAESLLADSLLSKEYLGVPDLKMIDPEVLARIPHIKAFSCIRIENQEFIEIENINMRNCWPMAVFAINSAYITLRNTMIVGSTYAFHAFGERSHHFLLEGNHWIQDGSARHRMWREICWSAVKGYVADGQRHDACPLEGEHVRDYSFFNGALFASWNIAGGVVVRQNQVSNAFNGIRMDAPRGKKYRDKRNLNVEIYANTFRYIRDNPIEPEATATNWWVHHNRIYNAHSWFSFDGVAGGEWYIFGNVGWFDERPYFGCHNNPDCDACVADPDCNLAWSGKVLKYHENGPYPVKPVYVFNNSWYLRTVVAGKGSTRNLRHWNNAIEFCKPKDPDDGICQVTNRPNDPDSELCGPLPLASPLRLLSRDFTWMGGWGNRFDYDMSSQCFPESLTANGQESHGVVAEPGERIFEAPEKGDFRLPAASPARDRGKIVELNGRIKWTSGVEDGKPDIGAFEGNRPMRGPPYRHFDATDLYRERPRIVDVAWRRDRNRGGGSPQLRVTFSIEIEDVKALDDPRAVIRLGNDAMYTSNVCRTDEAALVCEFPSGSPLPPERPAMILLPDGIKSVPQDGKREPMTLWASAYPNISSRQKGQ